MNHTKRLTRVLLAVLLFLMLTYPVQALTIHEPQGYINDHAGMLNAAQQNAIEKVINISTIDLYLYTVPSLEGEAIADLAQEIFQSWSLAETDVIMVISAEEREVHFEIAVGSALDKGFEEIVANHPNLSEEEVFTDFLHQHFVPHAAEGNIKQGVIMVTKELSLLNIAYQDKQNASSSAALGEAETLPAGAKDSEQQQTREGTDLIKAFFGSTFVLSILFVLLSMFLISRFFEYWTLTKEKKKVLTEQQKALVSVHQIELDLKPIVQFARGKSAAFIQETNSSFQELLQATTQFSQELENYKISFLLLSKPKVEAQLQAFSTKVQDFLQYIAKIKEVTESYRRTEQEVLPVVEEVKLTMKQVQQLLRKQLDELRLPLDQLVSRTEAMRKTVQEASESVQFDPLHVKGLLVGVPAKLTTLRRELELIAFQEAEFKGLPEKLRETKQALTELIKKEGLILAEIDPFSAFDSIEEQLPRLQRALHLGEIKTSTEILKRVNEWLHISLDKVNKSIRARDWGKEALSHLEIEIRKFELYGVQELEAAIKKVGKEYHSIHWKKLAEQIKNVSSNFMKMKQIKPGAKHSLDRNVQKYFEAEKNLTQMLQLLDENTSIQQNILHLKNELDAQTQLLQKEREELFTAFSHAMSRIQLHKLEHARDLRSTEQRIREQLSFYDELIASPLLHVYDLQSAIQELRQLIQLFEEEIEETVHDKNQVERLYSHFTSSYSDAVKRYRLKVDISYYNSEYKYLTKNIELAMKHGDYQKALDYLEDGENLIDRMRLEYQQHLDLEHERAIERQRLRNIQRLREEQEARNSADYSSSGSWGSSSSSRSGSSSGGGSSWSSSSGGSSSGGSSSWSSSSKSSGGSSSWSSSSSSSSGGSKGGGAKW